jgi:hypothetical protein
MTAVDSIIKAFGSQVALAEATGIPQQTISEWAKRNPPEIPPWRRPTIAAVAAAKRLELDADTLAYLHSSTRTPKAKAAA